jgi:hypothetical protein
LTGKLHRLLDCVDMVLWVLAGAAEAGSDGFTSLNFAALGATLTRHVCLTLRLVVAAPQSTHLRGGCFLLLRAVLRLESCLRLGRLLLTAGHLYLHSGGESAPSQLSSELPVPLLDPHELQELRREKLDIDALGMFRRAFTAQKATASDKHGAFALLTDIRDMSQFLLQALAADVHHHVPEHIHRLLTHSSAHRLLHPGPGLLAESPSSLEVAPGLPSGVPIVRATHWKKTKSAILFAVHKPHKDKDADTDKKKAEKEAQQRQVDVVTAKMALQRQEPSINFVFLKKRVGEVHQQVRAMSGFQSRPGELGTKEAAKEQQASSADDLCSVISDITSSDHVASGSVTTGEGLVKEGGGQTTVKDGEEQGGSEEQEEEEEGSALVSMPSAVSFALEDDINGQCCAKYSIDIIIYNIHT